MRIVSGVGRNTPTPMRWMSSALAWKKMHMTDGSLMRCPTTVYRATLAPSIKITWPFTPAGDVASHFTQVAGGGEHACY
jgi:hypothetical protein